MSDIASRTSSVVPLESEEEEVEEVGSSRRSVKASQSSSMRSPKVQPEPLDIEESSSPDVKQRQPSHRPTTARTRQHDSRQHQNPPNWYLRSFVALVVIVVLLILILVPLGYNELEYYEMGFHYNMATGYVDTSKIYYGGRHWVGVNGGFIAYPSIVLREFYNNVSIFNKEKMEVMLTFSFTYQLRYEDLKTLHETYGQGYEPIIRSASLAGIKGAAVRYTIDEFRHKRNTVAEGLKEAVAYALEGNCCRKDCVADPCRRSCTVYWKCDATIDMGYYSTLHHFQLHRVYVTDRQSEQYLKQVIEQEMEDTFRYQQEEKLVHMQTEQLELAYSNDAAQIVQNATAEGSLIKLAAVTEAESLVEYYRNQGLRHVFEALNVTEEEYKKSLDYVITLRNQNKASLYLGFQYMVANP